METWKSSNPAVAGLYSDMTRLLATRLETNTMNPVRARLPGDEFIVLVVCQNLVCACVCACVCMRVWLMSVL